MRARRSVFETQRRRRRGSTTGGNAEVLTGVSYVGSWKFPRDRRRLRRGATLVKAGRVEGLASVCRHRRRRRPRRRRLSSGDARLNIDRWGRGSSCRRPCRRRVRRADAERLSRCWCRRCRCRYRCGESFGRSLSVSLQILNAQHD